MKILLLAITTTVSLVGCIPPPHPAVVAARQAEELLPLHQRKPALHNPYLQEVLTLTSLLHSGEKPVFEREADAISRQEIYNILTHAGFIGRKSILHRQHHNSHQSHQPAYDSPFVFNSDALQYLK